MASAHLHWVREPQQLRSQDTLNRILDAAERLLETRPFEAISIADVTSEARSSVGSFYARFKDKESLLFLLQERLYAESYATVDQVLVPEAWKGATLDQIISATVRFVVQVYRERQGVRRAIIGRTATDPAFRDRTRALSRYTCEKLIALLESRPDKPAGLDLRRAVDVCHRIVYSVLDQNLVHREGPPALLELSDDELAAEIGAALRGYLTREPRARKTPRRPPERPKKSRPSAPRKKKGTKRARLRRCDDRANVP